jgi:hypothetical protein
MKLMNTIILIMACMVPVAVGISFHVLDKREKEIGKVDSKRLDCFNGTVRIFWNKNNVIIGVAIQPDVGMAHQFSAGPEEFYRYGNKK